MMVIIHHCHSPELPTYPSTVAVCEQLSCPNHEKLSKNVKAINIRYMSSWSFGTNISSPIVYPQLPDNS
jgi:hypothetical protein